MASADIDGDTNRDLIVANEGSDSSPGSVSILHGNGNGTFTVMLQVDPAHPDEMIAALPADLGTRAVAIGNIDADPALDIVALNSRSNPASVCLFTGDGHGAFTPRGTIPTGAGPQDVKLVDLNGDSKLDLVIAVSNEDLVSVRLGNCDLTFGAATSYPTGTSPTRLALGDLDDNDTLDIVASKARSGDITVLRGDGLGGFGGARTFVADAEP
jgi:FG-GAP-like repeat